MQSRQNASLLKSQNARRKLTNCNWCCSDPIMTVGVVYDPAADAIMTVGVVLCHHPNMNCLRFANFSCGHRWWKNFSANSFAGHCTLCLDLSTHYFLNGSSRAWRNFVMYKPLAKFFSRMRHISEACTNFDIHASLQKCKLDNLQECKLTELKVYKNPSWSWSCSDPLCDFIQPYDDGGCGSINSFSSYSLDVPTTL